MARPSRCSIGGGASIRREAACALAAFCSFSSGCGSDDGSAPTSQQSSRFESCEDYETFAPAGEPTFANDVIPLLQERCNTSICHGGVPRETQVQLWLGPGASEVATAEQRTLVIDQLVLVRSVTAPDAGRVIPGRPGESFLMLKLDDCHNRLSESCTAQPNAQSGEACGDRMPQLVDKLPEAERSVFRSWIALGARND